MAQTTSLAAESDWKYPEPDTVLNKGRLAVGEGHEIFYHEYGVSGGTPVMFIHGGPGGGTKPKQTRFFNPRRYRIILFDQRGCGRSTPNAGDADPVIAAQALTNNTTAHLVGDIEKLRLKLGIEKMLVFGGSWGSTLALAYAIQYPQCVEGLILRGIFLCRRKDLDYFYQGNAATFAADPYDTTLPGAYHFYPEPWKRFVERIEVSKRSDMVRAYSEIFCDSQHPDVEQAAKDWSVWEGATSSLIPDTDLSTYEDPLFAKVFARIENHYFMSGGLLGGTSRDQNYILENVAKIAQIPIYIVQGMYDQVCPRFQADELVAALSQANGKVKRYVITTAGHSQFERETAQVLTEIMDGLSSPVLA
jgi:proline iminopeptidase